MASRRAFLRLIQWFVFTLLGYMGIRMVLDSEKNDSSGEYRISDSFPEGISFSGPVIVCKKAGQLRIFSSACTHLGCRIDQSSDGRLICPCHGSEFMDDGRVFRGPAHKALQELRYKFDADTGEILVRLNPGT